MRSGVFQWIETLALKTILVVVKIVLLLLLRVATVKVAR